MTKFVLVLSAMLLGWNANAGCRINVFVKNTGNVRLAVENHLYNADTGVKTKGGVWRALEKGNWHAGDSNVYADAGQRVGDDYNAAFGCNVKRRYRVKYSCLYGSQAGNSFTKYYPSTTGWTTRQSLTVDLKRCK